MTRPIIVTGAAGFIGRNVVAELNRRGKHELILVDTLGKGGKWGNLRGLRYEDIYSPETLLVHIDKRHFADVEAIIHLGACSATTESDADYLLGNNYHYTRRLCEFSLANGVRFIYASSAATYGDGSQGYSDDDSVTETLHPLNMYGYSKHMFDLWAMKAGALKQIVGLKYFNVFGPYEDHKDDMRSMVLKSYSQIKESGKVSLFKSYSHKYTDGEQMRDFIYVKDAVAVTLWFLENCTVSGLYNCGTGRARTWKDLVANVFHAMKVPVKIDYIEMPSAMRDKYQYFTQAQMRKLHAAGYPHSFYSLENAITEYVDTYLKRQEDL